MYATQFLYKLEYENSIRCKEICLEVIVEKTKYLFMSFHQNRRQ
jgi:hypothetical protein